MPSAKPVASVERPPIVVVMGHVDHGKSTLLDYIRKANTVAKEAGGITQHVAAYEVEHTDEKGQKKRITFIDTPGHAAFQAIRARGAHIADIAILVVAADDGVKAQTIEALESIRAAGIPFIVAINKIDKPNASVERTQVSLSEQGVYLEQFGGDVPWAAISAKTGAGVPELLDLILLVAQMQEYRGDSSVPASGFVIEAHRDQKRGLAATLIITNGTLKSGMAVVADHACAPVRLMEDHAGKGLKSASFSTPVLLVGFDELPGVGAPFCAYTGKREAEEARTKLGPKERRGQQSPNENEETRFMLPLIVRADTTGSLEAIAHEMLKVGDEYTGVAIVQAAVGTISETDVKAAVASHGTPALVIGLHVGVDAQAQEHARQHGVRIETFDIIYKLTERVQEILKESAPKRTVEDVLGKAKVLKHFSSRKEAHLIGGRVEEGVLEKRAQVRIVRRGVEIGTGLIESIQANKQTVDRIETGREFGAQVDALEEIVPGDTLVCFRETQV